tara:strand:- start:6828 stop:7079 length:252 start_codon:yes stop_codon:yes gene_type:complete
MPYLIFTTSAAAVSRNDEAGNDAGLAHHQGTGVTRYVWGIDVEDSNEPRAALVIDRRQNLLTASETAALVDDLPTDWQLHPDP